MTGTHIRLRQSKGGRRVLVPVGAPLKAALDAVKPNRTAAELVNPETRPRRPSLTILATSEGTSWTSDCFRASWAKACARAGIRGLIFHDQAIKHFTAYDPVAKWAACWIARVQKACIAPWIGGGCASAVGRHLGGGGKGVAGGVFFSVR
jgi:integrase